MFSVHTKRKEEPMPNPITDYEREQQRKSIIKHTHQLILERRGIKNITVDDIVHSACMGKSTFYSIFKSKEICIYETFKAALMDVFNKTDALLQKEMTIEERTNKFFREVYFTKDNILIFLNPTVAEVLFRKLPPEYNTEDQMLLSGSVTQYFINGLYYDETQAKTLQVLFDCIDRVASNNYISEQARESALNYLVQMMVMFFQNEPIWKP